VSKDGKSGHLLFVWKASGYELKERQGDIPAVGSEVEEGEVKFFVSRIGSSPLPGDDRPCAYLQPV
jgi:hypothetical protein